MTRPFPVWILAVAILFIFALQVVATYWHLYFYIWWLDIPVHVVGGVWIALTFLSSYYASSRMTEKEHSSLFVVVFAVALTMTIGLFWEIYEFGVDHAVGDSGLGLTDTLKDLSDDLLGALIAAWIFIRFGYNERQ